jgi:acylphosphatase
VYDGKEQIVMKKWARRQPKNRFVGIVLKYRRMEARFHAFVRGSVQGVSFRWFARREASRLGLSGWVRNRFDGSVEVVAEGDRASLELYSGVLSRGPLLAKVEDVAVVWEKATGEFADFQVETTV